MRDDIGDLAAYEVFLFAPKQFAIGAVDQNHATFGVDRDQAVRNMIQDSAQEARFVGGRVLPGRKWHGRCLIHQVS